ncbi:MULTISPECIES: DUF1573 domain-containing protein [Rufibacter]|uniref:Archaellum component FlaG (FlaF/FlaG flagellin family) n=1 Tax=Rufibacter quisquiliarum TaxID=1549639 RepID=A0A839GH72_9BACT|nr:MULTISPECIES: DUF1573 domain-containing protein [Rufibacter]MBA9077920.1 archaellum component FlaG (FlaF/FlaG flagellin family) [Rufibacter quisquiliarum]
MKKIYFFLALALVVLTQGMVSAQGVLSFEKETHDFGTVAEGPVITYEFKVKNTGNQPVVISNVQASCGCTTPEWSKDPILPGKTAVVKAGYNTSGRPGAFNKALTITSNATPETQMLFIKGTVTAKEAAAPAPSAQEVANSAKLELTTTAFDFGKVEKGQKVTAKFNIKNTGKQDLTVNGLQSSCNCVVHKLTPAVVKPGQSAKLELIYNPQVLQNRVETVTLASNDITGSAATITLKANVVENLAKQSSVKVNKASVPFK